MTEEGSISLSDVGLEPWVVEGEWRHTRVSIGEEASIEGTQRPLTGVLFAWLDVATGIPPSGPVNPTIDLQVRLFVPPRLGVVHFRARTLRIGRTLYVGEVELREAVDGPPTGLAVATFLNRPMPFLDRSRGTGTPVFPLRRSRFGRLTGARRIARGVLELEANIEQPQGTVGGATLGRLVEQAAMVGRRGDATTVRVEVVDIGAADGLTTYALAVCRDRHSGADPADPG